jgi:lipoprotein signal peptidase
MSRCALVVAGTATPLAALDLAHKAGAGASHFHARSAGYVTFVLLLSLAWAAAIVLTRSPAMALGGGVLVGGAFGNIASLAVWPGVPNPIEVAATAFNLADVFVLSGFVLVAASTLAFARANRERLREPVQLRWRP